MDHVLEARDIDRFFQVDGTETAVLKGISFGLEKGSSTTIMASGWGMAVQYAISQRNPRE